MNRRLVVLGGGLLFLVSLVLPVVSSGSDTAALSHEKRAGAMVKAGNRVEVMVPAGFVRSAPDLNAPVKYRMVRGDMATVSVVENGWYHIGLGGRYTGWAHQSVFADPDRPGEGDAPLPAASSPVPPSSVDLPSSPPVLLNVNFMDMEIRDALSAMALEQEINIVTAREVSGKISVHLFQVPLEDAINAVTLTGGFRYKKIGDMYYVYKPARDQHLMGETLQIRVFRIRFAEVDKIKEILESVPGMRTIQVHESSRTVIVEDIPENIRKIETIIDQWDVVPMQVMIEARIMEVTLTDEMASGVNWAQVMGDASMGTGGFSSGVLPSQTGGSPVPSGSSGFFANLLTGAGTSHQFSLALDALKTKTEVNTLSTPKILAVHGKAARVQVGGQQGYKVTTTNVGVATETIEFIDTGTILQITPYIEESGDVLLNVRPSINSAVIEQGIPVVNSTAVSTWLFARNGETVFIGGLIQERETETRQQIPILGSIPVLGRLFGRTVTGAGKSELVVFITPTLIRDTED